MYLVSFDQCCSSRCILNLLTKLYMLTSYRTSSGFKKFLRVGPIDRGSLNRSYNDHRRKEWSKDIVVTFHSQSVHLLIEWIVHNQRYRVWRDLGFYLLHFNLIQDSKWQHLREFLKPHESAIYTWSQAPYNSTHSQHNVPHAFYSHVSAAGFLWILILKHTMTKERLIIGRWWKCPNKECYFLLYIEREKNVWAIVQSNKEWYSENFK